MPNRANSVSRRWPGWTACLFVALAGALAFAGGETAALKGEIAVEEYDGDGNVTSVSIYDPDWNWVLISSEGVGKELLGHVGQVARISGTIVELNRGGLSYLIHVSSYSIEKPTPDPER